MQCRNAVEKARYVALNPEYYERQKKLVCEIRHRNTYGHTEFINNPLMNGRDRFRAARSLGFRSGLEVKVARELDALGVDYSYEAFKITYTIPARLAKYSPDYHLPNGIIVETKGVFVTTDRQKHILIKEQRPDLDIRFVFSNANTRISKQSKTTYAMWCETKGFLYASKSIPREWLDEAPTAGRMEALQEVLSEQKAKQT